MRRTPRRIPFLFAVALLCAAGVSSAPADGGYAFAPRECQTAVGGLCTLSVVVEIPDDSVGCAQCRISFDADLLTLVDAGEGTLFTESGIQRLFFSTVIAPDTHVVEGCLLGYRTYSLTPGELVRFVFQGNAPGVAAVRIEALNLSDINRVNYSPVVDPYAYITIGDPTGVRFPAPAAGLRLSAWPNPFNPNTTLVVSGLRDGEAVTVDVFTPQGKRVREFPRRQAEAGEVRFPWDGRNDAGRRVGSGVYFAVATTGGGRSVHKLVLLQ